MKKYGFVCSAALGALLLSACSDSEGTADAGAPDAGAAEPATLKPGLWEMTATTATVPQPVVRKVCVGEAAPGTNPFTPQASDDCTKNVLTKTADGLAMEMECTTPGGIMTSKGTITGDMTSTYKMELTSKMGGDSLPAAAQVEMKMTIAGKRLGDCPTGAQPGQIVN